MYVLGHSLGTFMNSECSDAWYRKDLPAGCGRPVG